MIYDLLALGLVLIAALVGALWLFARHHFRARMEIRHLRRAVDTDSLTGLGNHRTFREELRREGARASRHAGTLTLALIDIDEFKEVNDTWGHEWGDSVLVKLAALLGAESRDEDRAFRIGGDEFAVLLPHTDASEAAVLVERIRQAAMDRISTTISVGVATIVRGQGDGRLLREQADSALYEAKRQGRDRVVPFRDAASTGPLFQSAKLESVRRLIAEDGVGAAFQPIWDISSGALLAYEALARPFTRYGFEGPLEAFALATRINRAHDLDAACRKAILSHAPEMAPSTLLFLNVSPQTFVHASFSAENLAREVRAAGLEPSRVVLEVTERSKLPVGVLTHQASCLREAGFKLALDNVGSGNSGLEVLRKVPVDYVKVDRSVLANAVDSARGKAVLMAIIAFASETDGLIIAEGIDDKRMLELVQSLTQHGEPARFAVYAVQGDLLSRPGHTMQAELLPAGKWVAA